MEKAGVVVRQQAQAMLHAGVADQSHAQTGVHLAARTALHTHCRPTAQTTVVMLTSYSSTRLRTSRPLIPAPADGDLHLHLHLHLHLYLSVPVPVRVPAT